MERSGYNIVVEREWTTFTQYKNMVLRLFRHGFVAADLKRFFINKIDYILSQMYIFLLVSPYVKEEPDLIET